MSEATPAHFTRSLWHAAVLPVSSAIFGLLSGWFSFKLDQMLIVLLSELLGPNLFETFFSSLRPAEVCAFLLLIPILSMLLSVRVMKDAYHKRTPFASFWFGAFGFLFAFLWASLFVCVAIWPPPPLFPG